jgi:CheY-like chemotaxis protein
VTAYGRPEDRARALAAGFRLHLTKPVTPNALAAAILRVRTAGSPDA